MSQEYVAAPPIICERITTAPLVGSDRLEHRPTVYAESFNELITIIILKVTVYLIITDITVASTIVHVL